MTFVDGGTRGLRHYNDQKPNDDSEGEALQALEDCSPDGWICFEDDGCWLPTVAQHRERLQRRGTFERALIRAYYASRGTLYQWDRTWFEELFLVHADRSRLLAESDPLPDGDEFTVFRGVAGSGACRRENGLSWTFDRTVASRFMGVGVELGLERPALLEGLVKRWNVIAYIARRCESEVICTNVAVIASHRR